MYTQEEDRCQEEYYIIDDDDDDDLQIDPPLYTSPSRGFIALFMCITMGLWHAQKHGLKTMVLGTWFCTVVPYGIPNMIRKYTKSKVLNSSSSGKSIVSYLGGARSKTLLALFMHRNATRPLAYFHIYKCLCTFTILIPFPFTTC